jgi:membrane-associated phospholipid phosphatase
MDFVRTAKIIGGITRPDYLFLLILWVVVDQGSLTVKGLLIVTCFSLVTLFFPAVTAKLVIRRNSITQLGQWERINPYLIGSYLLAIGLPLGAGWFLDLPYRIVVFYVLCLATIIIGCLLTYSIKISGHAISMAAFTSIAIIFTDIPIWVLLPLVPLVGASRVVTGDHTVIEVVVGAALGLTLPPLIFWSLGAIS